MEYSANIVPIRCEYDFQLYCHYTAITAIVLPLYCHCTNLPAYRGGILRRMPRVNSMNSCHTATMSEFGLFLATFVGPAGHFGGNGVRKSGDFPRRPEAAG